jgi:hypothetical protein
VPRTIPLSPAVAAAWDPTGEREAAEVARALARLRRRGLLRALAMSLGSGLAAWLASPWIASILGALAFAACITAIALPPSLVGPFEARAHAVTVAVGRAIALLVLAVPFYLVVTPLGLLLFRGRSDPLGRVPRGSAATHYVPRGDAPALDRPY